MVQRGCFITLEGGEGAGKTTQMAAVQACLDSHNIEYIATREPGGTQVAEAIRTVLLTPELPAMHADTELLLIFAARNEHIQQKILPALNTGVWVICDRFTDATYAYQGYGRDLPQERIAQLENWVQGSLRPDHTLLFDLDVSVGMQRIKQRSGDDVNGVDRLERESIAFHEKIRLGYLARAAQNVERYHTLDAAKKADEVARDVTVLLADIVQQWAGK